MKKRSGKYYEREDVWKETELLGLKVVPVGGGWELLGVGHSREAVAALNKSDGLGRRQHNRVVGVELGSHFDKTVSLAALKEMDKVQAADVLERFQRYAAELLTERLNKLQIQVDGKRVEARGSGTLWMHFLGAKGDPALHVQVWVHGQAPSLDGKSVGQVRNFRDALLREQKLLWAELNKGLDDLLQSKGIKTFRRHNGAVAVAGISDELAKAFSPMSEGIKKEAEKGAVERPFAGDTKKKGFEQELAEMRHRMEKKMAAEKAGVSPGERPPLKASLDEYRKAWDEKARANKLSFEPGVFQAFHALARTAAPGRPTGTDVGWAAEKVAHEALQKYADRRYIFEAWQYRAEALRQGVGEPIAAEDLKAAADVVTERLTERRIHGDRIVHAVKDKGIFEDFQRWWNKRTEKPKEEPKSQHDPKLLPVVQKERTAEDLRFSIPNPSAPGLHVLSDPRKPQKPKEPEKRPGLVKRAVFGVAHITTKQVSEFLAELKENISPEAKVYRLKAEDTEAFLKSLRPGRTRTGAALGGIAWMRKYGRGSLADRLGDAVRAYHGLREHDRVQKNTQIVVENSAALAPTQLARLHKVARRDGATVSLTGAPAAPVVPEVKLAETKTPFRARYVDRRRENH